jgi:PilZ domain.
MNAESVSTILKEGFHVGTKLGAGMAWYRNIVYRSEGSFVHLALIDRYLENIIAPGMQISVKYYNEFFVYLFEGVIHSIHAGTPGYIIIQVNDAQEIINTRMSPRYDAYLSANLKATWDNTHHFSVITDLSYGGMAFISHYRFEYGEEVEVTIYLTCNQIFQTTGKIIRRSLKNSVIDYSMQFIILDEHNCSQLSKYFSRLDSENACLYELYKLYSNKQ